MAKGIYVGVDMSGYKELNYIESTGAQYIDTGFIPNQNTRIIISAKPTNATQYAESVLFGTTMNSNYIDPYCLMIYNQTTTKAMVSDMFGNLYRQTTINISDTLIVDKNKKVTTINGVDLMAYSTTANIPTTTLLLSATRYTSAYKYGNWKIYTCQIYDADVLVRDFVPCMSPDGLIGMYDKAGMKFYGSATSTSFVSGGATGESVVSGSIARKIKKGYVGVSNFTKRTLPSEYTQIEYIESTGTQYIDTGFKPNSNTRLILDIEVTTGATSFLFGARHNGSANATSYSFSMPQISGTSLRADYGSVESAISINPLQRLKIDVNKNSTAVSGTAITAAAQTFTCSYNLMLLTVNTAGTINSTKTSAKVYSCQIFDNGTLIRDYVPCINSSGTAGLYDLANSVFYTNAGSGTFTTGTVIRNLPSEYKQVEYIQSSGTQYINTGYTPNSNTRVVLDAYNLSTGSGWTFGVWSSSSSLQYAFSCLSTYSFRYGSTSVALTTVPVGRLKVDFNKNAYNMNGTAGTLTAQTFTCAYPMHLFAINAAGSASSGKFTGRIYSCQIYDNGTLVRDYVPCINSNGIAGLYDVVNNAFYANAGTGAFTIGAFVGGVARRIKKGYVGIGGVARPFWVDYIGQWTYYGQITPLGSQRVELAAASTKDYALFGGGAWQNATNCFSDVWAYDKNLTQCNAPNLSSNKERLAATTVGSYALFGGGDETIYIASGVYSRPYYDTVDAYDNSLTITTAPALNAEVSYLAATTVGDYAIFAGGSARNSDTVPGTAYNSSLTKSATYLYLGTDRLDPRAAVVGNYALFGGGQADDSSKENEVTAFSSTLTKVVAPSLSVTRRSPGSASIGTNYALFAGSGTNTVDAYTTSLTRLVADPMGTSESDFYGANIGNFAIFAGRDHGDCYDMSLTRTAINPFGNYQDSAAATAIGDYALFGGGRDSASSGNSASGFNTVHAYKLS